jgi:hypothetical protein
MVGSPADAVSGFLQTKEIVMQQKTQTQPVVVVKPRKVRPVLIPVHL